MKTKYLAALLWIAAAYVSSIVVFGGCATTGEPNWPVIYRELDLGADTLRDAAQFVEDEEAQKVMRDVADVMEQVGTGQGEPPADVFEAVALALHLTSQWIDKLDPEHQQTARFALFAARETLRRFQAYMPPKATD